MRRRLLASLLALAAWPAWSATASVRERYQAFRSVEQQLYQQDLSDEQRAGVLAEAYATLDPAQANALNDADLLLVFDAADRLAYLSKAEVHARDMQRLGSLLAERGVLPAAAIARVHAALVSVRLLDEASQWRQRFPAAGLQAPPIAGAHGDGQAARLMLAADGKSLRLEAIPIRSGKLLIAIGHPDCMYCARFLRTLASDPAFGRAFAGRILWIAPQQRDLAVDALRRWNRQHPEAPLGIVWRREELPMLDRWSTPTFYFMKDGIVLRKLLGWPGPAGKADMLDALHVLDAA